MSIADDIARLDALRAEVAVLEVRVATAKVAQFLLGIHEMHPRARYVELAEGSEGLSASNAFSEQTAVLDLVHDPGMQCGQAAYDEWTGGLHIDLSCAKLPAVFFDQLQLGADNPLVADFDDALFDVVKAHGYLSANP